MENNLGSVSNNDDTDEEYLSMMAILGKTATTNVPGPSSNESSGAGKLETVRPAKKLKADNQEENVAMATPSSSKSFKKATIPIPPLIDLCSDEFDNIDDDPSVSWDAKTYVPNNVSEYVKQLQEMFPKTPVKYFEEEARRIIGKIL